MRSKSYEERSDAKILRDRALRCHRLAVGAGDPTFPVGRSKSPGYGHLKLPHSIIAVSAAEQR